MTGDGAVLSSQHEVSGEMDSLAAELGTRSHPRLDYPPYRSTALRHPTKDPQRADPEGVELWAPCFGAHDVDPVEADLTVQRGGVPIGERMVVTGRVADGAGRPVRGQLVEVWQANAAGRYVHQHDQHPAPLDPWFTGTGRCLTDDDGWYRFTTIRPGPYPWRNHRDAWRPAHIHFSLFGTDFTQRLVTQMYFPGDPLLALDPVARSVPDTARSRLVATYDPGVGVPELATGYRWDVVLDGAARTPVEPS